MMKQIGCSRAATGINRVTPRGIKASRKIRLIFRQKRGLQALGPIQRNLTVSILWNLETPS